jgi:phosphoribosylpyrophosphate synthetase
LKNRGFNNETSLVEVDKKEIDKTKNKFINFSNLEYATPELVKEAIIIMAEDEVDSGGTANNQARRLRKLGAAEVYMVFTHAVCTDPWRRKLFGEENPFSQVIVTDTIARGPKKKTGGKIHDVSIASTMASGTFKLLSDIL